jgi:hypothetical protein
MAACPPRSRRWLPAALPVALVLAFLIGGLPFGLGPVAGSLDLSAPHATLAPGPNAHVRPAGTINCPTGGYAYSWFPTNAIDYLIAPPYPNAYNGLITPCGLADPVPSLPPVFHDEVHATFSSPSAGSGTRVEFPFVLPNNTCKCLFNEFQDYSVSMVGTGDSSSFGNESYVQVYFSPKTDNATFNVTVAVWSLINITGSTCANGMALTYDNNYSCVAGILDGSTGDIVSTKVVGGAPINVTFVGSTTAGSAMTVYVNQSASNTSANVTLNSTNTGGFNIRPAFSAACIDQCVLGWGSLQGLAFSADFYCVEPTCSSYIETALNLTVPTTIDPPRFFTGGAYTGQYSGLSTQSLSGGCFGSVIVCPSNPSSVPDYPLFTFNGSQLNLGVVEPWTSQAFGGVGVEFDLTGYPYDTVPEWITPVTNSSLGGFLPPATGLTVDAQVQALGTTSSVSLNYTLPDKVGGNVSMSLVNGTMGSVAAGTSGNGWYSAQIPSTGGNGKITYRIWTTDHAGATVARPLNGVTPFSVLREPLPTFSVLVSFSTPGCGSVSINGTPYANGSVAALLPGSYPLTARLCYPFVFGAWRASSSLQVPSTLSGTLVVSGNGTLHGAWVYVRPLDTLQVGIAGGCGQAVVNGTSYGVNSTVQLLDRLNYSIAPVACGGYAFSGWTVSDPSAIAVLGGNLYLQGNGTLTANFIVSSTAVSVEFYVQPSVCPGGGVLFRGVGYANANTVNLSSGVSYPFHQLPCTDYGFRSFSTSGGVTVANGLISATSTGSVTETNYPLTLVTILTSPTWCGSVTFDNVTYGNDSIVNVTVNSVHSAFANACSGYYFTGFEGTGGIQVLGNQITVNASGDLVASFFKGTPQTFVAFVTNPAGCGSVGFAGNDYTNGQYTYVAPNSVWTLTANPCPGHGFVSWAASGGITVTGNTASIGVVGGSIIVTFNPLVAVTLYTSPSGCGSITLDGGTYTNGAVAALAEGVTVPISAVPCAGYFFAGWHNTTDAEIANGRLTLFGSAILTALFQPRQYTVGFFVTPATCGGLAVIGFGGGSVEYFNNTSAVFFAGSVPLRPEPCTGYSVVGWNTTGNVSVSGLNLTIAGNGNVTVEFGPAPLSVTVAAPAGSSSYAAQAVTIVATVAVPIPPYNYTYSWSFGDGSTATTPANFTTHIFQHTGIYRVEVTVRDPFGRTASANVSIQIVAANALQGVQLTLPDVGLLLVGLAVLLGVLLLARRRPPAEPEPAATPPTARRGATDEDSAAKLQEAPEVSGGPVEVPP